MTTQLRFLTIFSILFILLLLLSYILGSTFYIICAAFVLAYFFYPTLRKVERYKINKNVFLSFLLILFLGTFALILSFLIPTLTNEILDLINNLPALMDKFLNFLEGQLSKISPRLSLQVGSIDKDSLINLINENLATITQFSANSAATFFKATFSGVTTFFKVVVNIILFPVFFFFLINSYDEIISGIKSLLPEPEKKSANLMLKEINRVFSAYFRGQLSVAIFNFVFFSIGLAILGVKYSFLIGMTMGIFYFIPYTGIIIGAVLTSISIIHFSDNVMVQSILVAVMFFSEAIFENIYLAPKLIGKNLNLTILETLCAFSAGANLGGIVGIIFSIPTYALLRLLVLEAIKVYKQSKLF